MGAKDSASRRTHDDVSVDSRTSEQVPVEVEQSSQQVAPVGLRTLTKSLEYEDFQHLSAEVDTIDRTIIELNSAGLKLADQHPNRRWEYGMALRAIMSARTSVSAVLDVGAGESYFSAVLADKCGYLVVELEPDAKLVSSRVTRVGNWLKQRGKQPVLWVQGGIENIDSLQGFEAVTCISVLEHLDPSLEARAWSDLGRHVIPGGVLFITVDCMQDLTRPHVMDNLRRQNFTVATIRRRAENLRREGFEFIGTPDWTYQGATVYDYTFFAVAMRKK